MADSVISGKKLDAFELVIFDTAYKALPCILVSANKIGRHAGMNKGGEEHVGGLLSTIAIEYHLSSFDRHKDWRVILHGNGILLPLLKSLVRRIRLEKKNWTMSVAPYERPKLVCKNKYIHHHHSYKKHTGLLGSKVVLVTHERRRIMWKEIMTL